VAGSKGKYHEDFPLLAQGYARNGLNDEQIAQKLGISLATFYNYQHNHLAFLEALKEGKAPVDIQVENALLKRALGYSYTEETIEYNAPKDVGESPTVKSVRKVKKELPPDVLAGKFWLQNRKSKEWRDIKDVNISGSVESKVSTMTPEELDKRYHELRSRFKSESLTIEAHSPKTPNEPA
jgi:hypothetical protein